MSGSVLFLVQAALTGLFVGIGRTRVVMLANVALPPVAVWLVLIGFVVSMGVAMWLRHRAGGWERIRLVEEAPRPSG